MIKVCAVTLINCTNNHPLLEGSPAARAIKTSAVNKAAQASLPARIDPLNELKGRVLDTYGTEVYAAVEVIHATCGPQILKNFAAGTSDSTRFLLHDITFLFEVTINDLVEILRGAHVRLEEEGILYKKWEMEYPERKDRSNASSHGTDAKQFSLQNLHFTEFLWSRNTINGQTFTWFQTERHTTGSGQLVGHLCDFAQYRVSGKNQGPWGESPYTEKNPKILRLKQTLPQAA